MWGIKKSADAFISAILAACRVKTMIHNNSNRLKSVPGAKQPINPKISIVFTALIILRFYLLPFIFSGLITDNNYWYLASISSYTIIVLSVIIYRDKGLEIFQDHFSLWLIALGCFSSIVLGGENTTIYKGCLIFISMILSIYIIMNRKRIRMPKFRSIFIGLLWSIIAILIIALIYALLGQAYAKSFPPHLLAIGIYTFIYQFSVIAVIEEACFRGLLFSFMIANSYKENTALFIQAILFWGMHFSQINNPTLFFIVVPLGTLFMTLIIKKYKMLYLSIMMHTLINVFTTLLITVIHHLFQ
jgi:membrane protease YdiL (CAAX protease family)